MDIRVQRAAYFRDPLSFRKMTFAECIEFSSQNTLAIERIIWTCNLLCDRPISYHATTKTQVRERIFRFNLPPFIFHDDWSDEAIAPKTKCYFRNYNSGAKRTVSLMPYSTFTLNKLVWGEWKLSTYQLNYEI